MTVKIIDDIISEDIQNNLERNVLDSRFPWGYMHSSDLGDGASEDHVIKKKKQYQTDNIVDPSQFYHNILIDQQPGQFFNWFTPILDAIKYEDMRILRMKMNFNYPFINTQELIHGIPHVDLPCEVEYTTAIYYVTDADGDTILFNQKNGHSGPLTIDTKIKPKKGRIVLFDGNILHAACPPLSNKPRIVLNINIK